MSTLWEIDDEIRRLTAEAFDPDTGEIAAEYVERLEKLDIDKDRKCISIACYIKEQELAAAKIEAQADAIQEVAEKERTRARPHLNEVKRWKRYLADHFDGEKIEDERASVRWQKNPPKVEVEDQEKIPSGLRSVVPETWKPDKKAIADALKAGEGVPGCKLVQTRRLVIS